MDIVTVTIINHNNVASRGDIINDDDDLSTSFLGIVNLISEGTITSFDKQEGDSLEFRFVFGDFSLVTSIVRVGDMGFTNNTSTILNRTEIG